MDIKIQIAKIPLGASEKWFNQRKYLVTKTNFNQGKSTKVYAEQLGGNDFISFNFYLLADGSQLKPCEMPENKVLEFLKLY